MVCFEKMIKLFCFDLDGTALGGYEPYDQFPSEFCALLDRMNAEGIMWCTNTAWHPYAQMQLIEASPVQSRPVALIGSCGIDKGICVDGNAYLDAKWSYEITSSYLDYGINIFPQIKVLLEKESDSIEWQETERYVVHLKGKGCHISKIIDNIASHPLIMEKSFIQPNPDTDIFDLCPAYLSKGNTLKRLQKELGLTPETTMVAGDDVNDLTMFRADVARYLVAPGNACEQIKKLVHENNGKTSECAYSDGIIDAIEMLKNIDG